MEAIILLPDQAALEVFKAGNGILGNAVVHDSASSSASSTSSNISVYAIADDVIFDMPLTGSSLALPLSLFPWG